MKRIVVFIVFIWFLVHLMCAGPHLTRNYVSRYYTTHDGLVQMQVACIYQDRDGYMWFGTKNGASRFDGISFKNYTVRNGMPVGEVQFIGGWDDKIVMICKTKLVLLFPNDSIAVYQIPNCLGLSCLKYATIKEIDKNRLMLFNCDSKQFTPVNLSLTRYTHYIFNLAEKKFQPFKVIDKYVLYCDKKHLIGFDGIFEINNDFRLKKIAEIPNQYHVVEVDWKNNTFYFMNQNVIDKYLLQNGRLTFVENIIHTTYGGYISSCLLRDGSLLYFDGNWKECFYPKRNVGLGFDLTITNSMFIDRENNLWIGTDSGIYNFFNLNFEEYQLHLAKTDNIWSVVEDNAHTMWFGSYGSGLWKLDKSGSLTPMNKSVKSWDLQYMGSLKTNAGSLYFPSGSGVSKYEHNQFSFSGNTSACTTVCYDEINKNIIYSGFDTLHNKVGIYSGFGRDKRFFEVKKGLPRSIIKDSKGRTLLGSTRGLSYFTKDKIIEDSRKHNYNGIVSMSIDNKGRIWKGTENGVYVEMADGKEFQLAANRISDPIYSIMVYHNKYLLAGGIRCLFVVDIEKQKSYSNPEMWEIGYDAGFTGLESGQNGFCEDHNRDVWLTTALSVLKFNPEKLVQSQKQIIPPIRLAKLYYSENNADWKQITLAFLERNNSEIKLSSKDRFLRFEYIANSISAPKSLRFKYRLRGFSEEWSKPVYTKTAEFTNMGWGKYRFEVQCSLDGEHWSPVAVSPEIRIVTPFYFSPVAFIIFFLFILILSVYLTGTLTKRNQNKRLDILNRQKLENELQLNTLRSKVIPHFTKNVLSAIGYFAMTDKLKASHYISLFSAFTQSTLTNADKNYITLNEELSYIRNYLELEKMRFGEKFDYRIETSENVSTDLLIPTMTLHTYCDNAIRHGLINKEGNGLLTISIVSLHDGVKISVEDNGVGRKRAEELGTRGNGQGLKLIQAQLDFYNQMNVKRINQNILDLEDGDGKSLGTCVELEIPLDYKFI